MPPWDTKQLKDLVCVVCNQKFQSKWDRTQFCSSRCTAKRWQELNRERVNARNKASIRKRRKNLRKWLSDYKIQQGCSDCGYNANPVALDFDHIGKKNKNMGECHTRTEAEAEILLCEVRCANCHRIRTHTLC